MSTQITLNLPDDTYERAAKYAAFANRDMSEIIAAALASSLPSSDAIDQLQAISKASDEEVIALSESRMEPNADRRLSELLEAQETGMMGELEQAELAALMSAYEMGLLRQSQALAEAVKRGLRPPLES